MEERREPHNHLIKYAKDIFDKIDPHDPVNEEASKLWAISKIVE